MTTAEHCPAVPSKELSNVSSQHVRLTGPCMMVIKWRPKNIFANSSNKKAAWFAAMRSTLFGSRIHKVDNLWNRTFAEGAQFSSDALASIAFSLCSVFKLAVWRSNSGRRALFRSKASRPEEHSPARFSGEFLNAARPLSDRVAPVCTQESVSSTIGLLVESWCDRWPSALWFTICEPINGINTILIMNSTWSLPRFYGHHAGDLCAAHDTSAAYDSSHSRNSLDCFTGFSFPFSPSRRTLLVGDSNPISLLINCQKFSVRLLRLKSSRWPVSGQPLENCPFFDCLFRKQRPLFIHYEARACSISLRSFLSGTQLEYNFIANYLWNHPANSSSSCVKLANLLSNRRMCFCN